MKNVALLFAITMLFASCLDLRFAQTMPSSASPISEFPEELRGTFVSKHNKDTLRIRVNSVDSANIRLGEDHVLKSSGKFYILNSRKNNLWNVSVIRPCGNKGFRLYIFDIKDGKKRQTLNNISPLVEVYDEEGSVDYISTNPTDAQFEKMIKSKALVEIDHFKKLKK